MKDIIFKYELKDAFEQSIKSLVVDKENKLHLMGESNKEESISTIDGDAINKVLQKYEEQFITVKDEELPFVPVMDGYINEITFNVNGKTYNDKISNLGYYDGETVDNNKHLSLIFKLLDDVYDVLYKDNKAIEEYFILYESEDDEDTE